MRYFLIALSFLMSSSAFAVDARNYYLLPVGTDITEIRYSHNDLQLPSSLSPVSKATNDYVLIKHAHYYNFFGNLAAIYVAAPYVKFKNGNQTTEGVTDSTLLFAFGVYNMPALTPEEYVSFDKNGISSACSLAFTFPSNKFNSLQSEKFECQVAWTKNQFMFEATGGLTHFHAQNNYLGRFKLTQDNLYHFETHASYTFNPKMWGSFDTYYNNGASYILNGVDIGMKQRSLTAGLLFGYNIDQHQFMKFIYEKTVSTNIDTLKREGITISYNYMW